MANIGREEVAGAHDTALPPEFADLMLRGWHDDPVEVTPVEHVEHLARRRAQLSAAFPGETLVVPTGAIRSRTFGAPYPFRAGSDFLWLTGDHDPDSVLVLHPTATGHDAVLYAAPRADVAAGVARFLNRTDGEIWHGRRLGERERSTVLGIDTARLDTLPAALAGAGTGLRVLRGFDGRIDGELGTPGLAPMAPPTSREHTERDGALAAVLSELRLDKDEWEIAQLVDAVDATVAGFEDVARRLSADRPTPERFIEGVFGWRARVAGTGTGYSSIVGGGPHSTVLHWSRNDGTVAPGQVLLLDMGVENREGYTADVTRVLPVSGRFSRAQRDVYDIVHAARDAGLAALAPGVRFRAVHLTCMRVLAEGLSGLGLLPGSVDEAVGDADRPGTMAYRRWSLHGFGHMLGLDLHDCGFAGPQAYADGTLRAGQVLTMEPGLYLQPHDALVPAELRGVGVRIEDDVLITADGAQVLTAALPTEAAQVEAWLAEQREAGPREPGRDVGER